LFLGLTEPGSFLDAVISDALLSSSQLSSGSRVKLSRYSGILKTATSVSVELLSGDKDKTDPVVVLAIKSLLCGFERNGRPNMLVSYSMTVI
jgi:hypothetical protein